MLKTCDFLLRLGTMSMEDRVAGLTLLSLGHFTVQIGRRIEASVASLGSSSMLALVHGLVLRLASTA